MCFILLRRAGAAARQGEGGKRERIEAGASVVSVTPQSAAPPDTRVDGRNEPLGPKQRERAGRVGGVGDRRGRSVRRISSRRGSHLPPPLQEPPPRPWRPGDESRERDSEPRWVKSARPLPHWYSGKSALARLGSPPSPRGGARCFEEGSARAIAFVAMISFQLFIRFDNPSAGGISL